MRSRRIARYLVVRVMSWAHGSWCQLVVAERMLRADMNERWIQRVPWDEVSSGGKAGVKRGEMVGCGGDI
jgi:hypothetical protein